MSNDIQHIRILYSLFNFLQGEHPQTIAVILAYLDSPENARMLAELPYKVQYDVVRRIAEMPGTSLDVLREVKLAIERIQSTLASEDFTQVGGINTFVEILKKVDPDTEKEIIGALEEEDPEFAEEIRKRAFEFEGGDRSIQRVLREGDLQTIALILTYLDFRKSALILEELPHNVQVDVVLRMTEGKGIYTYMARIFPAVLREVELILKRMLSRLASEDFTQVGGIDAVVEILKNVDRSTEKIIIEALEEEDPELAEEIKKRMFVFKDIVILDDRSIQKVLREVDEKLELAKALKDVDNEVQEKIFRNMSKRYAERLKEDMDFKGPIKPRDVEEAQQEIINIIRKLEATGEIVVDRTETEWEDKRIFKHLHGGIDTVVEILNNVDRGTEKNIMEALEEEDPELAEEIKKRKFMFEDIVLLDDRSIQKVLREVDTQELAKALKGADNEAQEKIFGNMSKRAVSLLREDMDFMGQIRLRDVEDAQQKIVNIIRKLEAEGEIL